MYERSLASFHNTALTILLTIAMAITLAVAFSSTASAEPASVTISPPEPFADAELVPESEIQNQPMRIPTEAIEPTETPTPPNTPSVSSSTMPSRPANDTGTPETAGQKPILRRVEGCQEFFNESRGRSYTVCGRILDKYRQFGGPDGPLGNPTSDELTNPDGVGKRTSFANNSSIYWSPSTDAHQIGGEIGARWANLGYERGPLGYPTTDELTNPDGVGKRNWFEGGAIYWHPSSGAWNVWGQILNSWAKAGYEAGRYGYPMGAEEEIYGGFRQKFWSDYVWWGLDNPNCSAHIDYPHGSVHESGTTNVEGGISDKPKNGRCNRPVRSMGFELASLAESEKPGYYWKLVDWTPFGPFKDATYMIENVAWPDCRDGMMAQGRVRGYVIDYDGVSYALSEKRSPLRTITCTG